MGQTSFLEAFAFVAFVILLVVGLIIAARMWFTETNSNASSILRERYARGEITSDEYEERSRLLATTSVATSARWRWISIALVVVGLAGSVAVAASSDSPMMGDGMGSMMGGDTGRSGDAPQEGAARTVVTVREFSFQPATVEAEAGETINLVLDNEGSMYHTLTVTELDFELRANGGDEVAGSIVPKEPGSYEFICAVPGHADEGMSGTLVVE